MATPSCRIDEVVPHAGRMLFLDQLLEFDQGKAVVSAMVGPDHPFAGDRGVPAWVGIEYMAQAIAAWAGCRARARGEPTRLGFLLGTRRYQCRRQQFDFGSRLVIEANCEMFGDNGVGMFSCLIRVGDEVVANANLSVFEPGDASGFLEGSVT